MSTTREHEQGLPAGDMGGKPPDPTNQLREEQVEMRLDRLLPATDAVYNSSFSSTKERRECTANTRTEVLVNAHTWTRDDKGAKIYWMNGMAGTGKTTIAYSLCKKLKENGQLGASFFCSRNSPTCRDVTKLVPTIAYQLGHFSDPYRQAVCNVLNEDSDVIHKDIETQFVKLIVEPLGPLNKAMPTDMVVVIDALDECGDIDGTNQALNLLFRYATELPIKFFVTSRPEPSIMDNMELQNHTSRLIFRLHDIDKSIVQADIRTYLGEALQFTPLSDSDLEQLTAVAGCLFIFAAAVVRYIMNGIHPKARLDAILHGTATRSGRKYALLDSMYMTILAKAFDDSILEEEELELQLLVLRTVVCAREPSTAATLAELLRLSGERQVLSAIRSLRSVLHVSEGSRAISTLHASFPDFLLSEERSMRFHCGEVQHNEYLSTRCFELMKRSLRFNICGLETSYRPDRDVPHLQSRIDQAITSGLLYACRYWGDHLLHAASLDILAHLEEFLRHRLLFWVEVLNLKGWIGHGEGVLSQVLSWLPMDDTSTELREFTYDARNFVTTFAGNPTSLSTPHIYLSALPFTPSQSHVRTNYWPWMRGLLRVEGTGMEARGGAALATWMVGSDVESIAQSDDGKRIVSGCRDGTVSIWDVSNGARIVGPLQSGEGEVFVAEAVAFSPDGTRIASGSANRTIHIWDAHNGDLITDPITGHTEPVLSVAFSPDGTSLISGSRDRTIRMWDARNGNPAGNPFQGHQRAVLSVVFSPDGERIASGSGDRTIRIWDVRSATIIVGPLEGHTAPVRSVAFSPDGRSIVSGSDDRTVRAWDVQSGTLLADPFRAHTSSVLSVAFSPDGMRIVSSSQDRTIRMWDAQNGALIARPLQGHHGSINSVLFSPDGTRLLSGSSDGTIGVWDARHGTTAPAESSGHTDEIYSVAYSPDGTRTVSGSRDRTICVWDTRDGRLIVGPLHGHTGDVYSVAFSPDGAQLVSGSDDCTIRTWDARTGASITGPFEGHTGRVWSVAYSPGGRRVVSGSADDTIRVWDSQTGKPVAEPFIGHTNHVMSVAWSPDGTRIISGSGDRTVRMRNAQDGAALWTSYAHTDEVYCVAHSPDGTRVISGSADRTILVLNADDGTVLHGPFRGLARPILSIAFSPDGTRIVSGSEDHTVCMWDAQNGTPVSGPFTGHTDRVRSVAFSPDGRRVASCSDDHTIRFWEVATSDNPPNALFDHHGTAAAIAAAKSSGHTKMIYSVAFSPDGMRAVSGSGDRTIRVWDTHDERLVMGPLEGHTHAVLSVAFSPDGAQIVSGSVDRTLHTWDAFTGALLAGPFKGHTGYVWSVAFSPDGSRVASGSSDCTIRVWDPQTGEAMAGPFMGHTSWVMSVAFSPDGTRIVSGSYDKTIRMWNAHDGTVLWTPYVHSHEVYCVAYSPDSEDARVVFGSGREILVLNAANGTVLRLHGSFEGHTGSVCSVAFSSDGTRIVSGSGDCTVGMWDAQRGTLVSRPFKGHTDKVLSAAFSPDSRRVVSCSRDRTIRFWEVATADNPPDALLDQRTLRDDGWVTRPNLGLLMWLPPDLRDVFPLPACSGTIHPRGAIFADCYDLLIGERWSECYRDSTTW